VGLPDPPVLLLLLVASAAISWCAGTKLSNTTDDLTERPIWAAR
jgi:hypothetical protein